MITYPIIRITVEDFYMYKIYFYSEPNLLYIDTESLIDLDLKVIDEEKYFEMTYNDPFFDLNLKGTKSKSWSVTIQSYDQDGKFQIQSNLSGENLKLKKTKGGRILRLKYDQITNNKIWASIPPSFEDGEIIYKQGKVSYLRDQKLKDIIY
jgi:hypothetical protein